MKKAFFIFCTYGISLTLLAQPGALDLTFDPGTGTDYNIATISIQPDGKLIIGGLFTVYNGTPIRRLARLNMDGTLDPTFDPGAGASYHVETSAIQADGKIVIAGAFISYDSVPANRIMRVNTDGSPDTSFHTGTGFNDEVFKVVIQTDGKILVGGRFTAYNGNACNYLARLNTDGTFDNSFNMGTGPNGVIQDIAIQPSDGKLIIAGDFTFYGNNLAFRVARINTNGTYDASFNTLAGASHSVYSIAIRDNGKVLIGGAFTNYSIFNRNRIAQLNSDGTLDSGFDPGSGAIGEVRAITFLYPNNGGLSGPCLAGGDFTAYNSTPVNRLAVLEPNGSLDSKFDSGSGADAMVRCITRQHDGKMIISGSFHSYNGISRYRIARIYVCETEQPGLITGSDSVFCPGEVYTYSVPASPYVDRYGWTLPPGWTGSSDSASITVTTNGQGGEISVVAFTDSCGYSTPQTKTIYRIQPPEVPICRVTVDESSTHNVVVWKTPADLSLIDSFFVYRETTSGIFSKIASVDRNSVNYHDATANPNITSYRYKLSVLDICGVESALSPYHKTIHLQNLGNGNFLWTFYEIEGSSNPVVEFNFYRDNLSNGNFTQIGLVPGSNSTFTDVDYHNFTNSSYVVDVDWNISCTAPLLNVNTTRSNIRRKTDVDTMVSVQDPVTNFATESIVVYPNPARDVVMIQFDPPIEIKRLQLLNTLGQATWREERITTSSEHTRTIPVGALQQGVYVLAIETNVGWMRKMVVIW